MIHFTLKQIISKLVQSCHRITLSHFKTYQINCHYNESFHIVTIHFTCVVFLVVTAAHIYILYTVRKDLVPGNLEMICIEITKQHSRPFLVTYWYRPPNSEQAIFLDFEMFFFKSDLENKESIIMGDLICDVS